MLHSSAIAITILDLFVSFVFRNPHKQAAQTRGNSSKARAPSGRIPEETNLNTTLARERPISTAIVTKMFPPSFLYR